MKRTSSSSSSRAFTIIELLVVIVVIAILAAITIAIYGGIQNRANATALISDLRNAATQLSMDNVLMGAYPATMADADEGRGLRTSPGTTFQYTMTAATNSYCLTATSNRTGVPAYMVNSENTSPREGVCSGHTGPSTGGGSALNCPTGFIPVPGNSHYGTTDFCVMKYEAKNVGGVPTSQASGTPWVSINQTDALTAAKSACDGCQLITEAQWMTLAANVLSVESNWSGGSVGSGFIYSGHNDNNPAYSNLAASSNDENGYEGTGNTTGSNQRRTLTLTNGEVIWDLAGNAWEWTQGTLASGKPGLAGEAGGLTWKDYNNGSLQWNSLPSVSRPTGTLYPRSAGVGGLYSNPSDTNVHAFARGGFHDNGMNAGVLALMIYQEPSYAVAGIGFRVAR